MNVLTAKWFGIIMVLFPLLEAFAAYSPSEERAAVSRQTKAVAMEVVDQLKTGGKVAHPWLGVSYKEVTPELAQSFGLDKPRGALVSKVLADSPAQQAGVKVGDIIVAFNGQPVPTHKDLPLMVGRTQPGTSLPLTVIRDGKEQTLTVQIAQMSEEQVKADIDKRILKYEVERCDSTASCSGCDDRKSKLMAMKTAEIKMWVRWDDVFNEKNVLEMMKKSLDIAKKKCRNDFEVVNACIRDANDNNRTMIVCLAGGYIHKNGEIEQYYNQAVKKAEKIRIEKERREHEQRAFEQIVANRRAPLLAFLKRTNVASFVQIKSLSANPFVYDGKVIVVEVNLYRMLSTNEAIFEKSQRLLFAPLEEGIIFVSDVPTTRFQNKNDILLVGKVKGIKNWQTPAGGQIPLAHLEFVDAYEGKYEEEDIKWAAQTLGFSY